MTATDLAVIALFAMLVVLMVVERIRPARAFVEVSGWRRKCLVFMPVVIAIGAIVPLLLSDLFGDVALLPGATLGVVGGTLAGILVSELILYWVHRLHHRMPILWRWIHQLHHSAERVDVFGSAYFHPLEILEGAVVGVILFDVVLGLAPEATALAILWQAFNGVFQHGNIRTPVWLGYLVQRPEAHAVHHQRGVHAFNYANLPLWDLVFGTFASPRTWEGEVGFHTGSSRPTVRMLLGQDIANDGPARVA